MKRSSKRTPSTVPKTNLIDNRKESVVLVKQTAFQTPKEDMDNYLLFTQFQQANTQKTQLAEKKT